MRTYTFLALHCGLSDKSIIFALTDFTFSSSSGFCNSNETELNPSPNQEHIEPSNKEDVNKYNMKKGPLLLALATMSNMIGMSVNISTSYT